jgi:hypothetical protein
VALLFIFNNFTVFLLICILFWADAVARIEVGFIFVLAAFGASNKLNLLFVFLFKYKYK